MKIGVVVGRFQVDALTDGHKAVFAAAKKDSDRVVAMIGCPVFRNDVNPLSYLDRAWVIRQWDTTGTIGIHPVLDNISDVVWSRNLDDLLSRSYPGAVFTLYHGRDSFASRYSGKLALVEVPTVGTETGTQVRKRVSEILPFQSQGYRQGYISAHEHLRPSVNLAVDIGLFKYHGSALQVLLVKKANEDGWRFPGGMVDPSETIESAAKRELYEETKLDGHSWRYEGSKVVSDWRMRGSKHGVLTAMFSATYTHGFPKASDDAAEAGWFDWAQALTVLIEDHTALWRHFNAQSPSLV